MNVHEIIKDVVDNFALQLESKNGKVDLHLNATNDLIDADEVHFSNLVNNWWTMRSNMPVTIPRRRSGSRLNPAVSISPFV